MGLHTGEPFISEGDYVGLDVHLAAHIAAAGHGGQVVLSSRTKELLAPGRHCPILAGINRRTSTIRYNSFSSATSAFRP
jgi:class 3 adenylate cyclase